MTAKLDIAFPTVAQIRKGKEVSHTVHTPKGLDPDEAILQGWWSEGV